MPLNETLAECNTKKGMKTGQVWNENGVEGCMKTSGQFNRQIWFVIRNGNMQGGRTDWIVLFTKTP